MALGVLTFFYSNEVRASGISELKLESKWVKEWAHSEGKDAPQIYLIKQWHLSSSVDTKDSHSFAPYPQQENQTHLFQQLDEWISQKKISVLVAEGCEGEITPDTQLEFNHWSLKALEAKSKQSGYEKILSSVPFKLKAKYKDKIKVFCGDSLPLIKETQMLFSDARADSGYLERLDGLKQDPVKLKIYLDGVIEAYHLPKDANIDTAKIALRADLKKTVQLIEQKIEERSQVLVKEVQRLKNAGAALPIVIVFGGMHAAQVKKQWVQDKTHFSILEPKGYQNDEEKLIEKLHSLL